MSLNKTVVGEAAEWLVLAAKEPTENLTDVGSITTETEVEEVGSVKTCTTDNGDGTEEDDASNVPYCYVISKTKDENDSPCTCMSGPCGEVPLSTVLALRTETKILIGDDGICAATEGGKAEATEKVFGRKGIDSIAMDPPPNMLVRSKHTKMTYIESGNTIDAANRSVSVYLEAVTCSTYNE